MKKFIKDLINEWSNKDHRQAIKDSIGHLEECLKTGENPGMLMICLSVKACKDCLLYNCQTEAAIKYTREVVTTKNINIDAVKGMINELKRSLE